MTMNGASPVTQNINPPRSQSARVFCKPSGGHFFVGFVPISYRKTSLIHCPSQTLFATALTFADGMLTPAVSVTSAVAGLGLSVPSLNHNISSISIGILVGLFLAQRFGTAKLSFIFSPGMSPGPIEELLNNIPHVGSGFCVVLTHRWLWHLQHNHISGRFPCI